VGLWSSQLSTKRMAYLCRELAALARSDVPVIRSLELIAEHNRPLHVLLTRLADRLHTGATVAEALRAESARPAGPSLVRGLRPRASHAAPGAADARHRRAGRPDRRFPKTRRRLPTRAGHAHAPDHRPRYRGRGHRNHRALAFRAPPVGGLVTRGLVMRENLTQRRRERPLFICANLCNLWMKDPLPERNST